MSQHVHPITGEVMDNPHNYDRVGEKERAMAARPIVPGEYINEVAFMRDEKGVPRPTVRNYDSQHEYNEAAKHLLSNETLAGAVIRLQHVACKHLDTLQHLTKQLEAQKASNEERIAEHKGLILVLEAQLADLEQRLMRATASAYKPLPTINSPWTNGNQQGGGHYKDLAIEPTVYIEENNIGWSAGNVITYTTRHRDKGGADDLLKAMHYLQLMLRAEYGCEVQFAKVPYVIPYAPGHRNEAAAQLQAARTPVRTVADMKAAELYEAKSVAATIVENF